MIFGSDQGVGVSVDGGTTWSSWHNQPTGQFYHIATDNQFPYRVYGTQQDSGSVSITSRSDTGSITFRDWYTAGAGESGYIAPDPSDPNIVYGGETYGGLSRFDRRTGQVQVISPTPVTEFGQEIWKRDLRFTWTSPLVFSPQDPKTLYFGSQYLLRSQDRGSSWERISPDLTGADPNFKASAGGVAAVAGPDAAMKMGAGVIYTIAPSPIAAGQIWVGTDTGLIWLTRDGGKNWTNVTPPGLTAFSKISMIDAGHFDAGTVYAAVDRHRLDDLSPHIYVTHDFGKNWKTVVNGIPKGAYVRAMREDPAHKEVLFAATELGVYASVTDGATWYSLQANMPVVPVHDLVIHGNDIVVATHGRAFWILDDISPLRFPFFHNERGPGHLVRPSAAMRIRASVNTDTPLPPEEPAGENPPVGAIIYYSVWRPAAEITLEILDTGGAVIRKYSSGTAPTALDPRTLPFPPYWVRSEEALSREPGLHRFVWDLRYEHIRVPNQQYGMNVALPQSAPVEPEGPMVLPGKYQVRLTADGQSSTQPLEVKMDPRVTVSADDLQRQFALEMKIYNTLKHAVSAHAEIKQLLDTQTIQNRQEMARTLLGGEGEQSGGRATFTRAIANLGTLLRAVESADAAPTVAQQQAAVKAIAEANELKAEWVKVRNGK